LLQNFDTVGQAVSELWTSEVPIFKELYLGS